MISPLVSQGWGEKEGYAGGASCSLLRVVTVADESVMGPMVDDDHWVS